MFRETPWTIEKKNKKRIEKGKPSKKVKYPTGRGKKAEDLVGRVFGRLTVIKRVKNKVAPNGISYVTFLCKCSCGNYIEVRADNLRNGHTKSCGCLRAETVKKIARERITREVEKEVQKRIKQKLKKRKEKNKKSFSFKFFSWTIKISN